MRLKYERQRERACSTKKGRQKTNMTGFSSRTEHQAEHRPGFGRDLRGNYELEQTSTSTPGGEQTTTVQWIPATPGPGVRSVAMGEIPSTPGRGPDTYQRIQRTFMEDATQTEGTGQVDWRIYDTNKALRNLAPTSSRVRLLTLRRLHVRWHHPNDQQMARILTAAGAPTVAIGEVPIITQSCTVCRSWTRPGRRGQASFSTSTSFNQELQVDIMIYHSVLDDGAARNILHIIDTCTIRPSSGN
eukprot:2958405-Amphidinium_carterae.2